MASSMSGSTGYGTKAPSGYKQGRMDNFSPEQMELFKQMFSQVSPDSFLSKLAGGDEETFNQMEQPALRQFSGLQGNIASKYSGQGMGARRSSGFQNDMTAASSNFAQQLQSQRVGLQRQAMQDLSGMSNQLLQQKPFENYMVQKQQNPWADIAGKAFGTAAQIGTTYATGGFA